MANYGYRQYISFMWRYSKATASYAAVKDIERHECLQCTVTSPTTIKNNRLCAADLLLAIR